MLRIFRGCSRQDYCSGASPTCSLTTTTYTSNRLFEINTGYFWRPWKTRSVSTMEYLNRAVIWVITTSAAGKLWKSNKQARNSCSRLLSALTAALLFLSLLESTGKHTAFAYQHRKWHDSLLSQLKVLFFFSPVQSHLDCLLPFIHPTVTYHSP